MGEQAPIFNSVKALNPRLAIKTTFNKYFHFPLVSILQFLVSNL